MQDDMTGAGGVTRRGAIIGTAIATAAAAGTVRAAASADPYRPQVHFSPTTGFMNDPNGLVFADGVYHLYYQYNPAAPTMGRPQWGHATSRDLLHWDDRPIAIAATAAGAAFSGSAVRVPDNRSGLFAHAGGGIAALFTRASDSGQAQELAISDDGGATFHGVPANPVIDIGSDSFRDPKLFWHAPTARWVAAIVRAREHEVCFYASADLVHWRELSRFGHAGLLGIDYECPGLVELPVEGGGTRWVLFVSINPGAPQGGSCVQYFVGAFDGTTFRPDDAAMRIADFGKDYYALQTWNGVSGAAIGIAWMSNWFYTTEVPTGAWRGAMTLPRRFSLRRRGDDWRLLQSFVPLDPVRGKRLLAVGRRSGSGALATVPIPAGGAIELQMTLDCANGARAAIRFANAAGEMVECGFDGGGARSLWIDRGGARGFRQRYFTDKVSWAAPAGSQRIDLHVVWDRCSLELLALGGEASGTMLQFMAAPAERIEIVAEGGTVTVSDLAVTALDSSPGRGGGGAQR